MIQSFSYIASRHIHRFTVLAPWQFTAAFAIYSGINIGVDENNGRRAQSLTEWPREHRNQLSEVVGRKPTSNLNLWKYEHIYPQKNIMTLGHMSQKLLWFPPSALPHTWVKAVRSLEAKAPHGGENNTCACWEAIPQDLSKLAVDWDVPVLQSTQRRGTGQGESGTPLRSLYFFLLSGKWNK